MSPRVKHLAIIMDGNGRWAQSRALPRVEGHRRGVEVLRNTVRQARSRAVEILSCYAFSKENWRRPSLEVNFLMKLLTIFAESERKLLMAEDTRLQVIGDWGALPAVARSELQKTMELTKDNKSMVLQLALNYGSRDEIVRATKAIAVKVAQGEMHPNELNEKFFDQFLDTQGQVEPDLVIRTGGELRLSNFMLWQSAYSEFYFSELYWPEFNEMELERAFKQFASRKRRYGGLDQPEASRLEPRS